MYIFCVARTLIRISWRRRFPPRSRRLVAACATLFRDGKARWKSYERRRATKETPTTSVGNIYSRVIRQRQRIVPLRKALPRPVQMVSQIRSYLLLSTRPPPPTFYPRRATRVPLFLLLLPLLSLSLPMNARARTINFFPIRRD